MGIMQPLHDEHRQLWPRVDELRRLADSIEHLSPQERVSGVATAHQFLAEDLIPHARAEDAVLYPAVARVMGTPNATATMSRDHVEIGRLIEELGTVVARGATDLTELRRLLYGLYALLSVHFAKEEEIYLPLLERGLTTDEADWLFHQLGRVHHAHLSAAGA